MVLEDVAVVEDASRGTCPPGDVSEHCCIELIPLADRGT